MRKKRNKTLSHKEYEMMALAMNICRLSPLYLIYEYREAQVRFTWDKPNSKVVLDFYHSEIHCYSVEVYVYMEDGVIKAKTTMLSVEGIFSKDRSVLSNKQIINDFYNLMGIITRTNWSNTRTEEDTLVSCVRNY